VKGSADYWTAAGKSTVIVALVVVFTTEMLEADRDEISLDKVM
jgi:hypothetical protein